MAPDSSLSICENLLLVASLAGLLKLLSSSLVSLSEEEEFQPMKSNNVMEVGVCAGVDFSGSSLGLGLGLGLGQGLGLGLGVAKFSGRENDEQSNVSSFLDTAAADGSRVMASAYSTSSIRDITVFAKLSNTLE